MITQGHRIKHNPKISILKSRIRIKTMTKMSSSTTRYRFVLIRIMGFKMLIFGLGFTLYFFKLSGGIGFYGRSSSVLFA